MSAAKSQNLFSLHFFSSLPDNKLNICMLQSDDNLQSDDKAETCKHGSENPVQWNKSSSMRNNINEAPVMPIVTITFVVTL